MSVAAGATQPVVQEDPTVLDAVTDALEQNHHLVVEAPSHAGRIPSLLLAAEREARIRRQPAVVAVDGGEEESRRVTLLAAELFRAEGRPGGIARLAAMDEFLCLARWAGDEDYGWADRAGCAPLASAAREAVENAPARSFADFLKGAPSSPLSAQSSDGERDQLNAIRRWAKSTSTGHVSGLGFLPSPQMWSRLSSRTRECLAHRCPYAEKCHALRIMREARTAAVIITTHRTLFQYVGRWELLRDVIPQLTAVVLEDADLAPDAARLGSGQHLQLEDLRPITQVLLAIGRPDLAHRLWLSGGTFFHKLALLVPDGRRRIRVTEPGKLAAGQVVRDLEESTTAFKLAAAERAAGTALTLEAERAFQFAAALREAMNPRSPERVVSLVSTSKGCPPAVLVSAVDVSHWLGERLFSLADSVIVAGAALSAAGSFRYLREALGVPEQTPELRIPDVSARIGSTRLVVVEIPQEAADRDDWSFEAALAFERTAREMAGPVLGVFTCQESFEAADHGLRRPAYTILRWNEPPGTLLVRGLGAMSTPRRHAAPPPRAAGPSADATALGCVFLDRLPFPRWDDPALQAVKEEEPRWFVTYSLPRAILVFRRYLDRLLSSSPGRKVLVLHDPRILTRSYGRLFLHGLEDLSMSRELTGIPKFLSDEEVFHETPTQPEPHPASRIPQGQRHGPLPGTEESGVRQRDAGAANPGGRRPRRARVPRR